MINMKSGMKTIANSTAAAPRRTSRRLRFGPDLVVHFIQRHTIGLGLDSILFTGIDDGTVSGMSFIDAQVACVLQGRRAGQTI